ncbi:MAG: hypothetical protein K8T26_20160 [Lentisphaerae bacterium]|nr:hypothetical protein [Lentisphaerota bacterium]
MAIVKCPSCGGLVKVPEPKTGLWWGLGCLMVALAMPVIVAVVGLLAAIAIPSFVKARDTSQVKACINNMRILDAAKEQAAMGRGLEVGDVLTEDDVSPFVKGGFAGLVCPRGGHYAINLLGEDPACSVHGSLSASSKPRPRHEPDVEKAEP